MSRSLYFADELDFYDIWTLISQMDERRPLKSIRAEPVKQTQTFRPSSLILGGECKIGLNFRPQSPLSRLVCRLETKQCIWYLEVSYFMSTGDWSKFLLVNSANFLEINITANVLMSFFSLKKLRLKRKTNE